MDGNWIKQRREQMHLSQEQLAEQFQLAGLNVTRGAVSAWESGRNPSPLDSAREIQIMAKVLNLSVAELLAVSSTELSSLGRSEASRRAAVIVDHLPPEAQKLAIDQLRALEKHFAGTA